MIMNKVEDSLTKEYEDFIKEDIEYGDENIFTENNFKVSKITTEIELIINFYIAIIKYEYFFKVVIKANPKVNVKNIISRAIAAFNEKHFQIDINNEVFELKYNEPSDNDVYELKQTKKNLKPKEDMPPFCKDTILKNIEKESVSLVSINKKSLHLKKLIDDNSKVDKMSDNSKCIKGCIIF